MLFLDYFCDAKNGRTVNIARNDSASFRSKCFTVKLILHYRLYQEHFSYHLKHTKETMSQLESLKRQNINASNLNCDLKLETNCKMTGLPAQQT